MFSFIVLVYMHTEDTKLCAIYYDRHLLFMSICLQISFFK